MSSSNIGGGDITGPPGSGPGLKHRRTEAEGTTAGLPVVV